MINAKDGSSIWSFVDKTAKAPLLMDVYFGNFVPDQNGDGIPDILAAHTSQSGGSYRHGGGFFPQATGLNQVSPVQSKPHLHGDRISAGIFWVVFMQALVFIYIY